LALETKKEKLAVKFEEPLRRLLDRQHLNSKVRLRREVPSAVVTKKSLER